MSISTYEDLKAEIKDELARTDLTDDQVAGFIQRAEFWIGRRVRLPDGEQVTTLNVSSGDDFMTMPSGWHETLHFELQTTPKYQLSIVSYEKLTDVLNNDTSGGYPRAVAFVGNLAYVAPIFPADTDVKLIYYGQPAPLQDGAPNNTNSLITDAPDLLLYASLMYSAPFLGDDERIALWKVMRDEAAQQLSQHYWDAHAGGGKLRIRPDVVSRDRSF